MQCGEFAMTMISAKFVASSAKAGPDQKYYTDDTKHSRSECLFGVDWHLVWCYSNIRLACTFSQGAARWPCVHLSVCVTEPQPVKGTGPG